jgi:hypothetical protein
MRRIVRGFVVLCLLLVGLTSSPAAAAPGADGGLSQAERQRARILFRSAEASMAAGRWQEARRIFDDLLALNRGICDGKLDDWVSAYEDYQRAMVLSLDPENADQTFINDESQKGLREAARHTMSVIVTARPVLSTKNVSLLIDGVPFGQGQGPIRDGDHLRWGPFRLARRDHVVEVHADGRESLRLVARTSGIYGEQDLTQVIELAWPEPAARPILRAAAHEPREGGPASGAQTSDVPLLVGGIGLGLALTSVGLWGVHFAAGRDETGGFPYLAPAIATGGAALVAGAVALVLGATSPPRVASNTPLGVQMRRMEGLSKASVVVAPVGAGVGLVGSW